MATQTLTATDISNLSSGIVSRFISSMPSIVAEYTKETLRQTSGGSSGSKSKTSSIHEDKLIYDRVRRERDLTSILQKQLKLRAHELKVLRNVNDMYIRIVKEQGTYNNNMKHVSDSLAKSVGDSSKTIYGFYKEMDKFALKSTNAFKRLSSIQEEAKKLQEEIKRNVGTGQGEVEARRKSRMRLKELKSLLPQLRKDVIDVLSNARESMDNRDPRRKLSIDTLSGVIKQIPTLQDSTLSLDNFINSIEKASRDIIKANESIEDYNQTLGNKRKEVKQLDIILNEISRNMEQINHLSEIRGDIFAENDVQMASILHEQREKLQINLDMWDKVLKKTPERMEEFIEEVSNTASKLREESNTLLSELTSKKPSWLDSVRSYFEDLKRTITTGKNREGEKGTFGEAFDNLTGDLGKNIKGLAGLSAVFSSLKGLKDLSFAMAKEIAEDQRIVQKYGVNMTGWATNFQDSMGTGISNTQIADWKFRNRNTNTALGGERLGVEQFRRFMNIPTDYIKGITNLPEVEMLNYGGKKLSFSELIGGDSDYQAETYSALTDSLAKMGVLPTVDAIKKALIESNGIMDVSYKTGLLPKELIEYYGDIADGLYATAQINQVGADGFRKLTDNFLMMGRSLGANTEATKALNKSILANAKGDFVDQVTNQVYAQHYAKILGADDDIAKKFGLLAGAKGTEQSKLLTQYMKDPAFRSILEKQQSAMTSVYSPLTGANSKNILVSEFAKLAPGVASMFENMYFLLTKDARKGLNDPVQSNNKTENPDLSHVAQSFDKTAKALDQTTTKMLGIFNAGKNIGISTDNVFMEYKRMRDPLLVKNTTAAFSYNKDLSDINQSISNPSDLGWFTLKNKPISKLISERMINDANEFVESTKESISKTKQRIAESYGGEELKPLYESQMVEYQKTMAEKLSQLLVAVDKQEKLSDVDKRTTKATLENIMTQNKIQLPQTPVEPARGNSNRK